MAESIRRGEVYVAQLGGLTIGTLTLRWADVDLKRGLLTVQAAYAKSGKTRSVPLNVILRTALKSRRERAARGAEHVFCRRDGSPYRSIRTAFQTACTGAGLTDVTPHVLRHSFASVAADLGYSEPTIAALIGLVVVLICEL